MSIVFAYMDWLMNKVEQFFRKEKQLRYWIQEHPIVLLTVRFVLIAFIVACVAQAAWMRDVTGIIVASIGTFFTIFPMIWEGSDAKDSDSDGDDGPDDNPDTPTGDSADSWLRSRVRV